MSENINEDTQARNKEEPSILRQGTVPSRLNRVDIKSLLRQFRRILTKRRSRARLEQRERQHGPEHPRQLEYFLEFELLVPLGQLLVGRCITTSIIMPAAIPAEEPERGSGGIGEEVHEHSSPEDPGEVASFLT